MTSLSEVPNPLDKMDINLRQDLRSLDVLWTWNYCRNLKWFGKCRDTVGDARRNTLPRMLARDKLKGLVTSGFREINNIMILLVTISGRGSIPTDLIILYSGGDFFDCRNSEVWRWEKFLIFLESLNFKIWLRVEVTSIFCCHQRTPNQWVKDGHLKAFSSGRLWGWNCWGTSSVGKNASFHF